MIKPHAEPSGKSQLCGLVALLHHQHYSSGPIALGEAGSDRSNDPCRYQVEPVTAPLASRRIMGRTEAMCEMHSWSYDVDRCRVISITPQCQCCENKGNHQVEAQEQFNNVTEAQLLACEHY